MYITSLSMNSLFGHNVYKYKNHYYHPLFIPLLRVSNILIKCFSLSFQYSSVWILVCSNIVTRRSARHGTGGTQVTPSEPKWAQVNPIESKQTQIDKSEQKLPQLKVSPSEPKWTQVNPSEPKWTKVNQS